MSDPYEHAATVLQDGHIDPITGPRCMLQMEEGPQCGLYLIGHSAEVLKGGTKVGRDFITGKVRVHNPKAGGSDE
jgi:hypothetical protein